MSNQRIENIRVRNVESCNNWTSPYRHTKKLTKPLWSFSEKIEKRLLGTFFA
jgi:hypothetical protein